MKNDKTIEVLNKLLEINNDRLDGYETATQETDENDLKSLFTQLAGTSLRCKKQLVDEIIELGGHPIEGTKTSGKFFRAWMDIKAALSGRDRTTIISLCEFGEEKAIETYKNVLMNDILYLSTRQLTLVRAQYVLLKTDQDKLYSLRDVLVYKPQGSQNRPGSRASF
jgi:uncharacterized protein (TIGR02284 family)